MRDQRVVYMDLNMVRAGVVRHPVDCTLCGLATVAHCIRGRSG